MCCKSKWLSGIAMIKAVIAKSYLFKVNNRHTKEWSQICNFEHISHNSFVFYVIDFEHVNVFWAIKFLVMQIILSFTMALFTHLFTIVKVSKLLVKVNFVLIHRSTIYNTCNQKLTLCLWEKDSCQANKSS